MLSHILSMVFAGLEESFIISCLDAAQGEVHDAAAAALDADVRPVAFRCAQAGLRSLGQNRWLLSVNCL